MSEINREGACGIDAFGNHEIIFDNVDKVSFNPVSSHFMNETCKVAKNAITRNAYLWDTGIFLFVMNFDNL